VAWGTDARTVIAAHQDAVHQGCNHLNWSVVCKTILCCSKMFILNFWNCPITTHFIMWPWWDAALSVSPCLSVRLTLHMICSKSESCWNFIFCGDMALDMSVVDQATVNENVKSIFQVHLCEKWIKSRPKLFLAHSTHCKYIWPAEMHRFATYLSDCSIPFVDSELEHRNIFYSEVVPYTIECGCNIVIKRLKVKSLGMKVWRLFFARKFVNTA